MGLLAVIRQTPGGAGGSTLNLESVGGSTVLVIGSGGREAAIVDTLHRSLNVGKIYAAPGNPGMAQKAECLPIKENDIEGLVGFAKDFHIDMTVVGPEAPLSLGIVDRFIEEGLRIFGPTKEAARVESSKDFAKQVMKKYNIPTADYQTFEGYEEAIAYVKTKSLPIVLKYDGLAAGKGVVIAKTLEEAEQGLKDMLLDDKFGKGKVVIEDFLDGPEFSFMCLVNGKEVFPLELSQDHKRVEEGDKGPNTGGMGAYSPVPIISREDRDEALEKIMFPMAEALVAEGCPFKGLLYGGLIKTSNGVKVIEFNCRFGDPETEVVLPRLKSDLYEMFKAITDGENFDGEIKAVSNLEGSHFSSKELMPEIVWKDEMMLGFVLASKGYPGAYDKGFEIKGLDLFEAENDIFVFHMGTTIKADKYYTSGGRVIMVVGAGKDLSEARSKALSAIAKIRCENLFYRKDIGWRVIDVV